MMNAMPPGVGGDAARTAAATVGGTIDVAGQLSGDAGEALRESARAAFVRGLRLCAAISAIGSVALGIFSATALRQVQRSENAAGRS